MAVKWLWMMKKLPVDAEVRPEDRVAGKWQRWKNGLLKMKLRLRERLKFYYQPLAEMTVQTLQIHQKQSRLMIRSKIAAENRSSRSWANVRGVGISQARRSARPARF